MDTGTRLLYREEMLRLEEAALQAIGVVLGQLERVVDAVTEPNATLAQFVVGLDDDVDERYLQLHHGVLSLLVRQAPVAGDLRLAAALLHVMRNVERIGDQCVNVAKLVPLDGHEPPVSEAILQRVVEMGRTAHAELAQARGAFARRNVEMAEDLVRQDRIVNRLQREIFELAVDHGTDRDAREWAMHMTLVARAFERIGDNAVDIGEQTAFVVTGELREFADATRRPRVQ